MTTSIKVHVERVLATVLGYVSVELPMGFNAFLIGLTCDSTEQIKFNLWEQTTSDFSHKSDMD